jgi:hypothetical protein
MEFPADQAHQSNDEKYQKRDTEEKILEFLEARRH